jgi:hypothetical protein
MSTPFATVNDIETLWRPLSSSEQSRATALLPLISDELRVLAKNVNKDLDEMAAADEAYASVLKIVTVDVTVRVLRQSTEGDAMTQESQSALGYSWSGTYAVAGGGIANAILNNDLKKLGLRTQQIGVMYTWPSSKVSQ